jgi:hypothetical protein
MRGHASPPVGVLETVSGSLFPCDWDGNFRVTALLIACNGERELEIANLACHPGLIGLCPSMVRVRGLVSPGYGDRERIVVKEYSLLDPE